MRSCGPTEESESFEGVEPNDLVEIAAKEREKPFREGSSDIGIHEDLANQFVW